LQNIVDVDLYIPVYKLSIFLGHPCDYSNVHVGCFIIAISMQEKQHILSEIFQEKVILGRSEWDVGSDFL
jgi:hypothetical protein